MERKITQKLIKWKNKKTSRLPLLLHGSRQVGKTYILLQFAKNNYENFVYLNFEFNPALKSIFEGEISPSKIISQIEIFTGQKILPNKTLIFFDEIQECERALTSLKYFAELTPEIHISGAGSLLGVALNRSNYSFPVGKVDMETLFSLDFEEFLMAMNKKNLGDEIRSSYISNKPLPELLHTLAMEMYSLYLFTGGMPAVVSEYINSRDNQKIMETKANILNGYVADMVKYASAPEAVKVRAAFDSIPAQLAKENHKFQYKLLRKGGSASLFGGTIDWLTSSGIVRKCHKLETPAMPLGVYTDLSAFKLYMADTGLLTQKAGLTPRNIMMEENSFRGALTENYVAQSLATAGHEIFYWESNSIAEVDFIISMNNQIIPVEVKSSDNVRSRSLKVYIDKYKPNYAIRLSSRTFGFDNGIKSVPLYAAFAIEQ